jgi:hypothetical protein
MNYDAMREKHEARKGTDDTASRPQTPSSGQQSAESGAEAEEALCPLHLAMERIAQSAVSQTLYYAQGEYAPRPELLRELERWQQLHQLVATHICPALRTEKASAAAVTMACALIPEDRYAGQRNLIRRCASRTQSDPCPLESEVELRPFSSI